jgi:hypothetical protein
LGWRHRGLPLPLTGIGRKESEEEDTGGGNEGGEAIWEGGESAVESVSMQDGAYCLFCVGNWETSGEERG